MVSLPLLSSSTHAAPLLLRASRCLPLVPLVASSNAVEWVDKEEEEEEAGEAFDEEAGEVEEEVLASGDEVEGEYAAVEPPEEAKVYVGNLPYDIDSEGLAQLFDQAGVVEVAEIRQNKELSRREMCILLQSALTTTIDHPSVEQQLALMVGGGRRRRSSRRREPSPAAPSREEEEQVPQEDAEEAQEDDEEEEEQVPQEGSASSDSSSSVYLRGPASLPQSASHSGQACLDF
ncbi:31 kDa ribonucleoprotein, chloroplastic-like [Miscanthus floridulus]|uniref:31 kDa ribonucleoprotein, chloroplastic-like n=1 Tax=Miscanthus floridulus TaxID=154761 RepID=UPI003457E83C